MTEQKTWTEISNGCTCTDYDEETGTETSSEQCFGYCWNETLEMFEENTREFFDGYKREYRIENFRTWRGGADGIIEANTAKEFMEKLTHRINEWNGMYMMEGKDTLLFSISHHDVPTGGVMRITKGSLDIDE